MRSTFLILYAFPYLCTRGTVLGYCMHPTRPALQSGHARAYTLHFVLQHDIIYNAELC